MNNVKSEQAVIVGEYTGPKCLTCPGWIPVEGKEGAECRMNPAQMLAIPGMVQTLQGPQMSVMVQSFYPQTLGDHFCMKHPDLVAAQAAAHVLTVLDMLAKDSPSISIFLESAGLDALLSRSDKPS